MNVKILSLFLMMFVSLSFSACSQKEPCVEIIKIQGTCKTPDVQCDFRSESVDEILGKYLECIIDLKRSNEVCK